MLYPGLARRSQSPHRPRYVAGRPSSRPGFLENLLIQATKGSPAVEPATLKPVSKPVPTPELAPPPAATAPTMPPKAGAEREASKSHSKSSSSETLSRLELIANDFQKKKFNVFKLLAEATVFAGIVLLKWSESLSQPDRAIPALKGAFVLGFLVTYPVYCVLCSILICVSYAAMKLSARRK